MLSPDDEMLRLKPGLVKWMDSLTRRTSLSVQIFLTFFSSLCLRCFGHMQVGAWGCLNEFNWINIEVLSVIAQLF